MKKQLFFVLLILHSIVTNGQSTWHNYTLGNTTKTMRSSFINEVKVDSKGVTWVATANELTRIDGNKFTNYGTTNGLLGNQIKALAIQPNNDYVWIGTEYGVQVFDGKNWKKYTTTEGLVSNNIKTINFDKNNNAWIGTFEGISIQNGATWKNYNEQNGMPKNGAAVISIAFDKDGNAWLGGSGAIPVIKFNGTTFKAYSKSDGITDNYGLSLLVDSKGIVWLGGFDGYSTFDGTKWKSNTSIRYVNGISEDKSGNVWVAGSTSPYGQLLKINGTTVTTIDKINGENMNGWECIYIDKNNKKWLGSYYGLYSFDDTTWKLYKPEGGLIDNEIRTIKADNNGNMHLGTYDGISKVINNDWMSVTAADVSVSYLRVSDILIEADNKQWIANEWSGEILYYDGISYTKYSESNVPEIPYSYINCIFKDSKDNKWFGFKEALVKYNGSKWTAYSKELVNIAVNAITEDKNGKIYAATRGGISVFNGTTWTSYNKANTTAIKNDYFYSAFTDKSGNTWFGSDDGVYKFDGTTWTRFSNPGYSIYSINQDAQGNMWFGSSFVSKFDGTTWTKFTSANGLITCTQIKAITFDKKGNIWFGTDKGLSIYGQNLNISNLKAIEIDEVINIFPNPATNELIIETNELLNISDIKLYNINGVQYSINIDSNRLDLINLPIGVYILRLKTEKGLVLKRFIKQ